MNIPAAWRLPLAGFVVCVLALLALYFQTAASIVHIWNRSGTFAHGYVVMPIALWLVWRRRAQLATMQPKPAPVWVLGFVPLGMLWLLGEFVAANAAVQFAFAFMLMLLVPLLLGTQVARQLAFPLGFLLFGVPFGDFLTPALMEYTADFTVMAVRASGVPLYREGQSFVIPTGSWSVVEACSGIRYLMASVMVGTLYAYLNYRSLKKRWVFLAVSIVTPVLANWLRAYMIVMLGHLSGNKLAVGVDHLIYGWVFFGVIMFLMFMAGSRWIDPDEEFAPATSLPPATARLQVVVITAMLALASMSLPWILRSQASAHIATAAPVLQLPALPGWQPDDGGLPEWRPDFENPAAALQVQLRNEQQARVGVYVGYYRHQDQDSKLVTSTNVMVNSSTNQVWSEVGHRVQALEVAGVPLHFRAAELRGAPLSTLSSGSSTPRLQAWQIYWINGWPTLSAWQAKLYGAWLRLLGRGDDAAVVIIYTTKSDAADALLRDFVQQHWGGLDTWMRGVRDQGLAR